MKNIGKQKLILLISAIVVTVAGLFVPRPKFIQAACTSTLTPSDFNNCGRQLIWEQSFITKQIANSIFSFFNRNRSGFPSGYYGNDFIVPSPTTPLTYKPDEFQVESGKYITDEEGAIAIVKQYFPEVKKIQKTKSAVGQSMNIITKETLEKDGWRILFWQGSGDCPAGCLNNQYWYFIVTRTGIIRKIGEFKRVFNPRKNAFDETGLFLQYFINDCPSQKVIDCTNLDDPDRHWKCQQKYFDWIKTACPDITVLQP